MSKVVGFKNPVAERPTRARSGFLTNNGSRISLDGRYWSIDNCVVARACCNATIGPETDMQGCYTPLVRAALGLLLTLGVVVPPAIAGDVVVVMAPSAAPLTKNQLAGVYLGRNNSLNPVDLPESNPLRAAFYKKATDRDLPQIKAVWSRLTFTGQGQPPKEMPDAVAVKKAVAADPKAVGYIDKADLDASVKVVLELN
jgi:hypothetical protein